MEPGTLELQIFVSLIVILGTAFVALICDYLKGNNEHLREHNVELRVRREEQEKRQVTEAQLGAIEWLRQFMGAGQLEAARQHPARSMPAHSTTRSKFMSAMARAANWPAAEDPASRPEPEVKARPASAREEVPASESLESRPASNRPLTLLESLPVPAWVRKEQEEKFAAKIQREEPPLDLAARPKETISLVPPPAVQETVPPLVTKPAASHEGFWTYRGLLDRVVAATGTATAPDDEPDGQTRTREESAEQKIVEELTLTPMGAAAISTVTMEMPPQPPAEENAGPAPAADHAVQLLEDSGPLEAGSGALEEEFEFTAEPEPVGPTVEVEIEEELEPPSQPAAVAEFPAMPVLTLPPGYHDRSVLTTYLQSTDVLTGVVVAIGINDYSHHREKMGPVPMQELMQSVEAMVSGLLREGIDFGCRSAEDEFILVFPNEAGAEAQRRLTAISERLWNFQLRSLSNFSVLFSWGAVEVRGESLADSAASASERMYQTKRNRKSIPMDTQRRKLAVNL
ncbi:MAG: diguanylate cyclase [Bryobacterales bacterium]|nr:diguanylate cyclase [Bryobacterales bacterium]